MTSIRPVAARDVHAIAALQVRAWRAAYAGFVDEAHMPTVDDRIELWSGVRPGEAWVAEEEGQVAGVVGIAAGEVKVLYIDPPFQGHGLGSALLIEAECALRDAGHTTALVWTFRDNLRGRGFYERHGWAVDGAEQELWPGVSEVRYRRAL
jgi:GNAT superfamily N-acetyltransferase